MKAKILSILLLLCLAATKIHAEAENNLIAILVELRGQGARQLLPEEMNSLELTVARAEMYLESGRIADAERYRKMARQQAILITQKLAAESAEPQPGSSIQTATGSATAADAGTAIQPQLSSSSATLKDGRTAKQLVEDWVSDSFSSDLLVGKKGLYTVVKGDTLRLIAARLGVNRFNLAAVNGLKQGDKLYPGQKLKYNNQRIIPGTGIKDGLVINIPDRMLYLYKKGELTFSTAVALGVPTKNEQFDWQTPTGKFRITNKAKDPTWTVPPSIQEEMRLEGKEVITSVPPGKENPLGRYAIKTSLPGILIHSTTRPWSIYTFASHGCIRVFPQYMEELFNRIELNSRGEIIYRPVKLAVTDNGRVLLEVHGDIYNRTKGLAAEAQSVIMNSKMRDRVDWEKVKKAVAEKAGVAVDVTSRQWIAEQKTRSEGQSALNSPTAPPFPGSSPAAVP